MRRVSGKFGDKWCMLVKKSMESCVVSNEEGMEPRELGGCVIRHELEIRGKVIDVEGVEVAKGAKEQEK